MRIYVNPGDEIIIMLWGDTEMNSTYTVLKDVIYLSKIQVKYLLMGFLSINWKKIFNQLKGFLV